MRIKMQATKAAISNKKKCPTAQQQSGSNKQQNESTGAERPMGSAGVNKLELAGVKMKQSGSNNSVENDHEVEAITNCVDQVAKAPSAGQNLNSTSSNNNSNNNSNSNGKLDVASTKQQFATSATTSESVAQTGGELLLKPSTNLIESMFGSNNSNADHSSRLAKLLEPTTIGLDTKVPLGQHSNGANFQPIHFQRDEVSYYNESQTAAALEQSRPDSSNNSLEKAGQNRSLTKLMLCQQSAELYQNQTDKIRHESEPMQQAAAAAAISDDADETAIYDDHKYMTAEYNNLTDLHYDNAEMVDTNQHPASKPQQLHPVYTSGSYPRYQEISSPVPALATSSSSPIQDSCCLLQHQPVSVPTSPKAKSAPATPCNATPIAFHTQSIANASTSADSKAAANTMPPDIRRNISATCRALPGSSELVYDQRGQTHRGVSRHCQQQQQQTHASQQRGHQLAPQASNKQLDSLLKRAEMDFKEQNYATAIETLSKCVNLATRARNYAYVKENFRMYSLRAEAHFKLNQYHEAIEDSMAARELNPELTQAYYLQGQAQFMIGQHADSLAAFSFGLTQDPNNEQLFEALVDAALKSSFGREFQLKFAKLKAAHMERRPFVVMAVLGQELLVRGHSGHAAVILESALKLSASAAPSNSNNNNNTHLELTGANQRKLQCSVLSTISLAYYSLRDYDKAIHYMSRELEIGKEIEDVTEQCRVLNNLGYAYQKVRKFDNSLEAHRKQLSLAMKNHLYPQASRALNAIGHVHSAKDDFSNALTSHTRCLDILRQLDDCYAQFKELLDIGHVHLMLNDLKAADEKFEEANQLLKQKYALKAISQEEFSTGLLMVQFNLAHIALRRQSLPKATQHYQSVIDSIRDPNSTSVWSTMKRVAHEMRACNGLGQVCRLLKKFDEAREWFEKQLRLAKILKDQEGQSRALCNLGMICQHYGDHLKARQLFEANLKLVENSLLLKAYAHSYLGSASYLMNHPEESRNHYRESLRLFEELGHSFNEQEVVNMNLASIKRRAGRRELAEPSPTAIPGQNNLVATNQKKVVMA